VGIVTLPETESGYGRLFLRKLKDTLKIPVLALVDSDPYGLKILSVFMKGDLLVQVHGIETGAIAKSALFYTKFNILIRIAATLDF
jgi:DNA topoisomerase VI subunit A